MQFTYLFTYLFTALCVVEMGALSIIYVPSFINTGSSIQTLMGGGGANTKTGY
jgi:hypothetical protein